MESSNCSETTCGNTAENEGAAENAKANALGRAIRGKNTSESRRKILAFAQNPPLTVDAFQAAALLSVSDDTIRREISRGNLKAAKVGRLLRIYRSELEAYLARRAVWDFT